MRHFSQKNNFYLLLFLDQSRQMLNLLTFGYIFFESFLEHLLIILIFSLQQNKNHCKKKQINMNVLKINQITKRTKNIISKQMPIEIEVQSFSADNFQMLIQESNYIFNNVNLYKNYKFPTDMSVQKDSFQQIFKDVMTPPHQNQVMSSCPESSKIQSNKIVKTKKCINIKSSNASKLPNPIIKETPKLSNPIKKNTKKRTDQYIFKRRHTIIKQCLKKLQLSQLINNYQSYRKDYFILTMSLIESRNLMKEFAVEYEILAINAINHIDFLLKSQKVLQENIQNQTIAKMIIQDSRLIVQKFCKGNPKQAFDKVYNFNIMLRTHEYNRAKNLLNSQRHKLGLSLI